MTINRNIQNCIIKIVGTVGIVFLASTEKVYTFFRLLPIFKQPHGFENRHFQNFVSAILKKRKIDFAIFS